jgi:hypothetical protein
MHGIGTPPGVIACGRFAKVPYSFTPVPFCYCKNYLEAGECRVGDTNCFIGIRETGYTPAQIVEIFGEFRGRGVSSLAVESFGRAPH